MKTSKTMKILIIALLLVTVIAAGAYLALRAQIPEDAIVLEYGSTTYIVDLQGIKMTEIHGERMNGKGEIKPVDGMGFHLQDLVAWTLGKDFTCDTVTITASDGVSAEITADELNEEGKVVLLWNEEDGRLQLIVFGDSDSKRSVKQVERIEVK